MASVLNSTIPVGEVPTPLVFFSPQLAYQLNVATYLHVGSTGALVWDVIDNLGNDFRLLYYYKIQLPTIAYFVSRISILGFCIGKAVLLTVPVADCNKLANAVSAFLIIFVASTTGLFYLRVCAVYDMKRTVVVFFGASWLISIAMVLTFSITYTATHIENTHFCGESVRGHLLGPSSIVLMVNDVLIYFAIAYRIYGMFFDSNTPVRQRFNALAFGTSLPLLSKALLQDSQLYLLVALLTNAFLVVSNYVFEDPIKAMFVVCHIVLVNILACRVYRNIKMGLGSDVSIQLRAITALQFSPPAPTKDTTHRPEPSQASTRASYLGPSTPNLGTSVDNAAVIDMSSMPSSTLHRQSRAG